jgi:hypothetical protein
MVDLAGALGSIVVLVAIYGMRRAMMPELASPAWRRRTVPVAIEGGRGLPRRQRMER